MRRKRIVSSIAALAMAASAFAGMAVTASAAGTQLDIVTFDNATADVRQNFTKNQVIGETIVYEFDVYVPDGTYSSFAYYNGGNLGPTFFLDASREDGNVWVMYQTARSGPYEINANLPYSRYLADSWAHVAITNTIGSDGSIGNSFVQFSSVDGNDAPFIQENEEGNPTVRHPYNGREIVHRNIYGGRLWDNVRFDLDEVGGVQVTNQKIYTAASKLTLNDDNATVTGLPTDVKSYDSENGIIADNTYNLTVTANDGYILDAVKVDGTEVEALNGTYTVSITKDTVIDIETTELSEPEPPKPEKTVTKISESVDKEGSAAVSYMAKFDVTGSLGVNGITWTITGAEEKLGESKPVSDTFENPTTVTDGAIVFGLVIEAQSGLDTIGSVDAELQ